MGQVCPALDKCTKILDNLGTEVTLFGTSPCAPQPAHSFQPGNPLL